MEVLVRNLDEAEDLIMVFLQRLIWRTPRTSAKYTALLACSLYVFADPSGSVSAVAIWYAALALAFGA
jgi:hypothetical protein